jgi:enoyl-CoA hydratase/carnithine racemase
MLGEKIDANTALNLGLVYAVVPSGQVLARAQSVARTLAAGPSGVLGQIRALHASTFDHSFEQQLAAERSSQEMMLETHQCIEGVRAFFQKKDPDFSER